MKKLIVIIAACIILALLLFARTAASQEKQFAFFSAALGYGEDAGVPLAELKTRYAQALATSAPILGLAGTEPGALERAVENLAQAISDLTDIQPDEENAEAIAELYPLDFLRAIAELERRRSAFVASGSADDEERYAAQLGSTLDAYERAIAAFKAQLERITLDTRRMRLVGTAGYTTPERMLDMLAALEDGATRAREEHAARARCLSGRIASCDAADIAAPSIPLMPESGPRSVPPLVREFESIRKETHDDADTPHEYVALETACIPGGPHIVRVETVSDPQRPPILYAEDFFLSRIDESAVSVLRSFHEHGIEYIPVSPFNFYICAEAGRDLARARAITAIAGFAREHPLVAESERANLLAGGVLLESDAIAYVNAALAAPEAADTFELARMLLDGSAGLDSFVSAIAFVLETDIGLQKSGVPYDLSANHLFITHGAFPSLLLAQNPLSGTDMRLYEPASGEERMPIERYSDLRDSISRAALIEDMRAYLQLERRL